MTNVATTETVIITEQLTVMGTSNTTYEITGSVKSNNQTAQITPRTITVKETPTESTSVIDEYDTGNDGINKRDAQKAIRDFIVSDELNLEDVQKIIRAFIVG